MFNEKVIINSVGRELKGGKEKAMSPMMNEGLENQMLARHGFGWKQADESYVREALPFDLFANVVTWGVSSYTK
jgi:uncharacterized NAD-dependent epimerase/dehydratase family protein